MDLHDYRDVAENYDAYLDVMTSEHDSYEGFQDFYLDLARTHGQAGTLDVACGTGAVLLPLLQAGLDAEGTDISEAMCDVTRRKAEALGLHPRVFAANMTDLLSSYYRETERTTDMIYLATNFHVVVDPSITYSADTTANHKIWNNTYSDDEDLWDRAVKMRQTEPEDDYEYVVRWIAFQERYNEVLPTIPIYSNIYYDFYSDTLQNYYPSAHVTWTQAILSAYFGEPVLVMDEELEEGGEVTFDE